MLMINKLEGGGVCVLYSLFAKKKAYYSSR